VPDDTYTHGHHEAVLRSHRQRTAANSAAYLLDHLRPSDRLLDVGCGPGTITLDLARLLFEGSVLGVDRSAEIVDVARAAAESFGAIDVEFAVDDIYDLSQPDGAFDVVHAHQVLQHLTDPVAALREMRRVLRDCGTLAVRDSDYGSFAWSPDEPLFDRWMTIYQQVARHNHAEPNAGRYLLGWVHEAGFSDAEASSSTWTWADDEKRAWWGGLWADRITQSSVADQAVEQGFSTPDELREISEAFRRWSNDPSGVFIVVHGEVLAHR
jgi:ubiquinone/menaquinone biosynthesis C-methylase UbiE